MAAESELAQGRDYGCHCVLSAKVVPGPEVALIFGQ